MIAITCMKLMKDIYFNSDTKIASASGLGEYKRIRLG